MYTTQKQIRKSFWEYLKEFNPKLYNKGKRSKRQNEQITDIRVYFCDYVETLRQDNIITESMCNKVTL